MENTAGPRSALVWDDAFLNYRFSETHPMNPVRLKLTHRLAKSLGVLDRDRLAQLKPPVATDAELAAIHSVDYIAQVTAASAVALNATGYANLDSVYSVVCLRSDA